MTTHSTVQPKNILFLASWYPSLAHRTLGNFVQRHAEAVATLHHVHVLFIAPLESIDEIQLHHHEELGVKSTIAYYPSHKGKFTQRWKAFQIALKEVMEQQSFIPDLVHLNVIRPDGWQAAYIHRRYKIPYIITEHWTGYDTSERPHPGFKVKWLSLFTASRAAIICPVTDNLGASMRQFGLKGNYITVPNVVDTSLFELKEKSNEPVRFLHISSLHDAQKNISGLLRAWKKATELNSNIHLTIGGDGPVDIFESMAKKLGIPNESITFFHEKPWNEIALLMQEAHCLLMFSNYENLPCVIVEAMASGMAVISTDVGGIKEHITAEFGYLINRRDEEMLSRKIIQFTENKDQFQSHALHDYAEKHFSIPAIANQFNVVYQKVWNGL